MLSFLTSKILGPALIGVVGIVAGMGIQQKMFAPDPVVVPECPACNCPAAQAVTVQPFEVEKIKNLRAFTYSPEFTGQISVAGVDSASVRHYIDQAVMKAFDKHVKLVELQNTSQSKRKRK